MIIVVTMPALSPTMESGNLGKWLKKIGELVSAGDPIAEIETDKATMEFESAEEGILGLIVIEDGAKNIKVGDPICVIGDKDEDFIKEYDKWKLINSKGSVEKEKANLGQSNENKINTEIKDSNTKNDTNPNVHSSDNQRIKISPIARRILSDKNIDPSKIHGTGPFGRIIKSDVINLSEGGGVSKDSSISVLSNMSFKTFERKDATKLEITSMRGAIAKGVLFSKNNAPHFYIKISCRMDKLLTMRLGMNEALEVLANEMKFVANKLTVNDFIVKATAKALEYVPQMNVSWQGSHIDQYHNIEVSVAVSIEDGLMTPIVENANLLSLDQISFKVKELVGKAKDKKLKPSEFQGGSITISNLGMFDVDEFSAIINTPQASILAIGATKKVPIVIDDKVEIASMMNVTLSGDHRVIDGALAAQYLKKLKYFIENPLLLTM